MAAEVPCPLPPAESDQGAEAALVAWLMELCRFLPAGGPTLQPDGLVLAIENRAARAVQGLALQRAFSDLHDPVSRVRLVQLVEAMVAAERAHAG